MLKHISILLPFLVSLFWTIHFLFNRKRNTRSQNIWIIVMALFTITMAVSAFYWYVNKNYSLFYKLDIIETFSTLLFIPFIFLYFKELTGDKYKSRLMLSLWFIPPILFAGASAAGYLLVGNGYATAFTQAMIESNGEASVDHIPYHQLRFIINEYTYNLLLFMQAVSLFIYAVRRLVVYRKHLCDFFADIDDKDLKHHWAVLWGVLAFVMLTFIVAGLEYTLYIEYHISVSVIGILYATIIYFICHHVSSFYYADENFAEEVNLSDKPAQQKEEGSIDNKNHIHLKFLPAFNQVIDEDKIYLQKGLRLDDVATIVGTNRTYISRILKDEYNCSFWEFINRKRIEYAKEQALLNPGYTVEYLAEICGFSHGSAFSRAFHQYEEITFKEWQKKIISNSSKA